MRYILLVTVTFCLFSSCQPSSMEDFQLEGGSQMRLLLEEFKKIHHREDLARQSPVLQKRFESMVDLMIRARMFYQKHPELEKIESWENQALSQLLQEEMERIYVLEGGKECIEKAQREAMLRLDAKEKILERLQTQVPRKT